MTYHSQTVQIAKDQIIFKEGEDGDCAYIVEKGRVLVFITKEREEIPLSILGEGEIFGEMSLIDSQNRSATVRALENVTLRIVTKQQLLERISISDSVVQLLVRVLLKRLRRNNIQSRGVLGLSDLEIENTGAGDDHTSTALSQIQLENQLFAAFQNREFELYYQPIVELASRKIIGCEALIRWNCPTRGIVPPNDFIDTVESSSMAIPIGHWVIGQALKDLNQILTLLKDNGRTNEADKFMMSINISGRQFTHEDFVSNLEMLRGKNDVPAKNIKLEITERVMMDGAIAIQALEQCRSQGYAIAIDDFGTGFSSLQYLTMMPISFLKIDRSFVMKIVNDPKSRAVVSAIIHLAQAMDIDIIAEGIETNEECLILETLGSKLGQGYLFSRPVDYKSFIKNVS